MWILYAYLALGLGAGIWGFLNQYYCPWNKYYHKVDWSDLVTILFFMLIGVPLILAAFCSPRFLRRLETVKFERKIDDTESSR